MTRSKDETQQIIDDCEWWKAIGEKFGLGTLASFTGIHVANFSYNGRLITVDQDWIDILIANQGESE